MLRRALLLILLTGVAVFAAPQEYALSQETIDIELPSYEGYISVAPNGRYFVDEAGTGFLIIGQNDAISWPGPLTLIDRLSPEATENYIIDLRAHGVTVSRIMIEYAQEPRTYFENPVGTFSESMVQFWDDFIALAEKHGLYLLLVPYDTYWQARNWATYPYSAAMGGPCETMGDWLTKRECIEAHKNRWRFFIDRWGGSPNIMAWELANEIDIWWNASVGADVKPSASDIRTYIDEMAAFVREYEMEKHGRAHLLTVSSAAPLPDRDLGDVIYNHPLLDFANTHLYIGEAIRRPENPIEAGPTMAGAVVLSLEAIKDNRPYTDTESGPIDNWITDPRFDAEYHHNMSWGHLAAGGAGSGMRWPYTTPHWILPEMRDNLLGLARFATRVDWVDFASDTIVSNILTDNRNIIRAGCSDGETAIVWLLLDTRTDESLTFGGRTVMINRTLADGEYTVELWETYSGTPITTLDATVENNQLRITLPDDGSLDELKDLAILIRPLSP